MKELLILVFMFVIMFSCVGIISIPGYRIYNTIELISHHKNKYIIYSGIRYYSLFDFFNNGNIEYQIFPCFEGSKKECKQEILKNKIILDSKLKEFRGEK